MKKNLSELVFILDKSGSMSGKEDDTIGSFNATLKEHIKNENDVLVTTVLFSDSQRIIHDRISIKDVKPLDREQYKVDGCTALIDAMGDSINHIKDIHKYQREEDVPDHTIFIIVTDGMENASHKYSNLEVKKLVECQKEKGWEFIFLGANIDSIKTAQNFSIDESRAVNYINDSKGINAAYSFVSKVTKEAIKMPKNKIISTKNMKLLREEVDKDYITRSK